MRDIATRMDIVFAQVLDDENDEEGRDDEDEEDQDGEATEECSTVGPPNTAGPDSSLDDDV